jgi:hypothetical protein
MTLHKALHSISNTFRSSMVNFGEITDKDKSRLNYIELYSDIMFKFNIVFKMRDVPVPGYQSFSTNNRSTLKPEHSTLVQQYPERGGTTKTAL